MSFQSLESQNQPIPRLAIAFVAVFVAYSGKEATPLTHVFPEISRIQAADLELAGIGVYSRMNASFNLTSQGLSARLSSPELYSQNRNVLIQAKIQPDGKVLLTRQISENSDSGIPRNYKTTTETVRNAQEKNRSYETASLELAQYLNQPRESNAHSYSWQFTAPAFR